MLKISLIHTRYLFYSYDYYKQKLYIYKILPGLTCLDTNRPLPMSFEYFISTKSDNAGILLRLLVFDKLIHFVFVFSSGFSHFFIHFVILIFIFSFSASGICVVWFK